MLDTLTFTVLLFTQTVQPAADILGTWRGTSICTRIPENSACHDEIVVYDFAPSKERTGAVTLDPKKIVDGRPEPMGTLDFSYDDVHRRWTAEFGNTRVHLRWSFTVSGDEMTGTCVLLPAETVVRNVNVKRVPGKSR